MDITSISVGFEIIVGMATIFGSITAIFSWKIRQIKQQAKFETLSEKGVSENAKDINLLKEKIVTLEAELYSLRDRVARTEGAFSQHNRESIK